MQKTYIVRAFDTDYGFDTIWDFDSKEEAEAWKDTLLFDYGSECEAYITVLG